MKLALEYKVFRHAEFVCQGVGRTVNISSGGILFRADRRLEPDWRVELSIEWPRQYAGRPPLRLQALCEVVRTSDDEAAVRVMRHEFRTVPGDASGDAE